MQIQRFLQIVKKHRMWEGIEGDRLNICLRANNMQLKYSNHTVSGSWARGTINLYVPKKTNTIFP